MRWLRRLRRTVSTHAQPERHGRLPMLRDFGPMRHRGARARCWWKPIAQAAAAIEARGARHRRGRSRPSAGVCALAELLNRTAISIPGRLPSPLAAAVPRNLVCCPGKAPQHLPAGLLDSPRVILALHS